MRGGSTQVITKEDVDEIKIQQIATQLQGPKAGDWQKDRVSVNVVVLPVSPHK